MHRNNIESNGAVSTESPADRSPQRAKKRKKDTPMPKEKIEKTAANLNITEHDLDELLKDAEHVEDVEAIENMGKNKKSGKYRLGVVKKKFITPVSDKPEDRTLEASIKAHIDIPSSEEFLSTEEVADKIKTRKKQVSRKSAEKESAVDPEITATPEKFQATILENIENEIATDVEKIEGELVTDIKEPEVVVELTPEITSEIASAPEVEAETTEVVAAEPEAAPETIEQSAPEAAIENTAETEPTFDEKITAAQSSKELQGVLYGFDGTVHSDSSLLSEDEREFTANELLMVVSKVFAGEAAIEEVTRKHGLREKVNELYMKENAGAEPKTIEDGTNGEETSTDTNPGVTVTTPQDSRLKRPSSFTYSTPGEVKISPKKEGVWAKVKRWANYFSVKAKEEARWHEDDETKTE